MCAIVERSKFALVRRAAMRGEVTMCFVHSDGAGSGTLVQRAAVGEEAAAAFSSVAAGEGAMGAMDVAGSGTPDVVAGPGGERGSTTLVRTW